MSGIMQRIKNITHIPDECRSVNPPAPKSVKIELTTKCNYRCAYCSLSFRPKEGRQDMDFGLFKKITKEMKEIGVEEIGVFYIGESFSTPQLLIDSVKYLKEQLEIPYVFLTTNGSLAKPDVVRELMRAGLNSLKWSCNFASDEQFEQMSGVSAKFFKMAKDNIETAYRIRKINGFTTGLVASSIKYDDAQVEKMKPFLEEFIYPFVDKHYWLPLYTMGGTANEKEKELGYQPVAGNPANLENPVDPLPCWTVFTAGHVLVDGSLTACCMDGLGRWVMGDLKKNTFMECWHSEEFKKLRIEHLRKNVIGTKCEKCALVGE